MKNDARGAISRISKVFIVIAVASLMLSGGTTSAGGKQAGGSAVAGGGGNKPAFVSGNSTGSDCGLAWSDWSISLTGDLEGCWSSRVTDHTCKELADFDLYFEEGREVFVGEFHGKQGRFRTTYTLEAVYAKGFCDSFDPTLQVGGGCDHKIKGGSGVFKDARGRIKFIDVIAGVTGDPATGEFQAGTGGNNFLYYGRIKLDDRD